MRSLLDTASAPEAALILAAQARDQAAFGELVRRRQGWARSLLRRMCRNDAEADDLAQEAFVKAWERLRDLETPAAFAGWFRRVAVTTFLMAKRRQKANLDPIDDAADLAADGELLIARGLEKNALGAGKQRLGGGDLRGREVGACPALAGGAQLGRELFEGVAQCHQALGRPDVASHGCGMGGRQGCDDEDRRNESHG